MAQTIIVFTAVILAIVLLIRHFMKNKCGCCDNKDCSKICRYKK